MCWSEADELRGTHVYRKTVPIGAILLACGLLSAGAPFADVVDLDGRPVDPFRVEDRTTVLLFTRTDCPISNRYAPEVRRIFEEFQDQPIDFWLVYPEGGRTPEQIREHLAEYGYSMPAILDPSHELVALSSAQVTPEAAVFVKGKLIYHGRIDDRHVAFGTTRPAPTVRDLERTLQSIVDGVVPEYSTEEAVGCFIVMQDPPE